MTEPLMEDEEGLTIAWDALSGDEVVYALQTAPQVAGAWVAGDPKWCPGEMYRNDLSSGFTDCYEDGERIFAAHIHEEELKESEHAERDADTGTITLTTIMKKIFFWEAHTSKGQCTTLEEAKAACDQALEKAGWVFATMEGEEP